MIPFISTVFVEDFVKVVEVVYETNEVVEITVELLFVPISRGIIGDFVIVEGAIVVVERGIVVFEGRIVVVKGKFHKDNCKLSITIPKSPKLKEVAKTNLNHNEFCPFKFGKI